MMRWKNNPRFAEEWQKYSEGEITKGELAKNIAKNIIIFNLTEDEKLQRIINQIEYFLKYEDGMKREATTGQLGRAT